MHAGCMFVASVHLSRTWMSGSFEFEQWNACVHRLDLGLYSHLKELWWKRARNHVKSNWKIPSTRGSEEVRSAMLHHTGQWAQYTTNRAILPPLPLLSQSNTPIPMFNSKWFWTMNTTVSSNVPVEINQFISVQITMSLWLTELPPWAKTCVSAWFFSLGPL